MYIGHRKAPGVSERMWSVNLDASVSGEYQTISNDSTSPAMDQSGLEPSSVVQVQSKKFFDRDQTDPQFFGAWTELAWTALDHSTRAESARIRWELLIH